MTNAITINKETRLDTFGSRAEIRELSQRIQMMLPGGQKYTEKEALTLAQMSVAHGLDPFNGECWLIKDDQSGKVYGSLVGIKGHRKLAKKQSNYWGQGGNGGFERVTDPKKLAEYGAADDGDICFEYRIADEVNLKAYASSLKCFIEAGFPFETAQKMAGAAPVTLGVGVFKRGEKSKMKPAQCAMFRAEKDALKRRFDVKFRVEVEGAFLPAETASEEDEIAAETVEAEYTERLEVEERDETQHRDADEVLAELGFEPQAEPETAPAPSNGGSVYQAVVAAGLSENEHAAKSALEKHCKTGFDTPEKAVAWMRLFRAWRDLGAKPETAGEKANTGQVPS